MIISGIVLVFVFRVEAENRIRVEVVNLASFSIETILLGFVSSRERVLLVVKGASIFVSYIFQFHTITVSVSICRKHVQLIDN